MLDHVRNHTDGKSYHSLRIFDSYQDKKLIEQAMNKIVLIKHHIISAATKEFHEETKKHIRKLSLSVGTKENIQKIKQSNKKKQLKIQESLKYLAEFKKDVYQMKKRSRKATIDSHCLILLRDLACDSFIENKIKWLHKENSSRFDGIIDTSYDNGWYIGKAKNSLPEGRGVFRYDNGDIYEGEFKGGQPEGRGLYKPAGIGFYDGEFKDRQPEGKGVCQFANGNAYNGEFIAGKLEGKGVCKFASGDIYDGEFKDGVQEGRGVAKLANGDLYDGDY